MGIILFNLCTQFFWNTNIINVGFRPLMGIILFNFAALVAAALTLLILVSVP